MSFDKPESIKELWQKVDYNLQSAKPVKASKILDKIIEISKKQGLTVDLIKAYGYKRKVSRWFDNPNDSLARFYEAELKTATKPVSYFLHFYLAEVYASAFSEYKPAVWQYDTPAEEMRFWSIRRFADSVFVHSKFIYGSLDELNKLKISDYKEVVSGVTQDVYKTLADVFVPKITEKISNTFLSGKYAPYFTTQGGFDASVLKPYDKFTGSVDLKVTSLNFPQLVKAMYAKNLLLAQKDKDCNRFAQIEYDRLSFLGGFYSGDDATEKFMKTLEYDLKKFENKECAVVFAYYLAKVYDSTPYSKRDTATHKYRFYKVKAAKLCKLYLEKYPKHFFAGNIKHLYKNITEAVSLSVNAEDAVLPDKHFLITVRYKNLPGFTLKYYKVSSKMFLDVNHFYRSISKLVDKLGEKNVVRVENITLPAFNDYREHTVEIIRKPLPKGFYFVKVEGAGNPDFLAIQVTSLGYAYYETGDDNRVMSVTDLADGRILPKAQVNVISKSYKGNKEKNLGKGSRIDLNGVPEYGSNYLVISYKKDTAVYRMPMGYSSYGGRRSVEKDFIYTDRYTYKPGEVIKYAVVSVQGKNRKKSIVPNNKIKLVLRNNFGRTIWQKEVVTGENGLVSGEIPLPDDATPGAYYLAAGRGSKEINVEAYKLPKYKIDLNTLDKPYVTGDTVTVKGKISTYSGMPVTGAKVEWKVYRQEDSFIKFSFFSRRAVKYPVAQGTTTAKSNGDFTFNFPADYKSPNGVTDYEVKVKIILPSGETRETARNYQIADKPFYLSLNSAEILTKSAGDSVFINVNSVTGAKVYPDFTVKVYKLDMHEVPFVKDKCYDCDTVIYSKKDWYAKLPYYKYADEKSKPGKLVWETTTNKTSVHLPGNLQPGKYMVEVISNYNGQEISAKETVFLTETTGVESLSEKPFYTFDVSHIKGGLKGGEQVKILVGSGAKKQHYHILAFDGDKLVANYDGILDGKQKITTLTVPEKIEYNYSVYVYTVFNGEFYSNTYSFPKYEPSVKLKIEHLTDKTQPGKKEKVILSLVDDKNKPAGGFFIAAMTDKSLENFGYNAWNDNIGCYDPDYYVGNFTSGRLGGRTAYLSRYHSYYDSRFTPSQGKIEGESYGFYGYYTKPYIARDMAPSPKARGKGITMAAERELEESPVNNDAERGLSGFSESKPDKNDIVRQNFTPTAFFFAGLSFDKNGKAEFSFVVPDALTTWHFRSLAYTPDWKTDIVEKDVISNKPLMVVTDMPRFLREGDKIVLPVGVSNLTDKTQTAKVELKILDGITEKQIALFEKEVSVGAGEIKTAYFEVTVPEGASLLQYVAKAGTNNFTDAEKDFIPVLTNRKLVTQTLPFYINKKGKKTLTFKEFNKYSKSATVKNLAYTVEVTSNPLWFAVQAIPYLYKGDYRFLDEVKAAYFATVSGDYIIKNNPGIKKVFEKWKKLKSKNAFLSALDKNKELKDFVLENTPWVADAASETEQKRSLGLLFDANTVSYKKDLYMKKLLKLQDNNGAWKWYKDASYGGLYSTLELVEMYGKLRKYYGYTLTMPEIKAVKSGLKYIEKEIAKQLENIKKYDKDYEKNDHLSYTYEKYLLIRAYWSDYAQKDAEAAKYFESQAVKFWSKHSIYERALMGEYFVLENKQQDVVKKIIASIKDVAKYSDELGRYWQGNSSFGYFYNAGVLGHTAILRFFTDAGVEKEYLNQMKIWLIKHKQTNMWESNATTIEAVQLLLSDKDKFDLNVTAPLQVKVGDVDVTAIAEKNGSIEPGTGYYKVRFDVGEIKSDFGKIEVTKQDDKNIGWGAVYWQYFENFDKIGSAGKKLKIRREIYKETEENGKKFYTKVENGKLQPGDKIKIRLVVTADRDYEFVAVRDYRPSGFEPVGTKSSYGSYRRAYFYREVFDERTDFYFRHIPKGTLFLEYEAYVKYKGDFSGGISIVQSLYSPEFMSNSSGIRIKTE